MKASIQWPVFTAFLFPVIVLLGAGAARGSSEVPSVVKQSVSVNTSDWNAQPNFSYLEQIIKSKVGDGTSQGEGSKTFQVTMVAGTPYQRLVATQDEPLSRAQEDEEQEKWRRELKKRQGETADERRQRIAKYNANRAEEHLLMQQMVAAFHFRLTGEETVDGVPCFSFEATPNPDYQPPVEKARVLTGMRGHMWIDKQAYHWVKVQAQVTQPVSFGFFIARVKPGTSFELEQAPVGNVWLPKRFVEIVNASVLGLYGYRTKEETLYSHYADSAAPLHAATAGQ